MTFVICAKSHAQQGIAINNTGNSPDSSAILDVSSANHGLLIPRIALTQTTSKAPITSGVATGLLVYNTSTVNNVSPGFYYWDGSKWVMLMASSNSKGTHCFTCDGW
ncbi:MAG: hypothetical protein HGB12_12665 [Bacteroidetes bacterium]|nr:hypothetical protein [Bacteroidota bacterium]